MLFNVVFGLRQVDAVVGLDEAAGRVYFSAVGREAGCDPYLRQLYSVRLDGAGLITLLTPASAASPWADHAASSASVSPTGTTSLGRERHSNTTLYISLAVLYTTYTGWPRNDFDVHA